MSSRCIMGATNRSSPAVNNFGLMGGVGIVSTSTTEARRGFKTRIPGAITLLCISVSAVGASSAVGVRKNSAAGAGVCGSGTLGFTQDTTNTDNYIAADTMNVVYVGSLVATYNSVGCAFLGTSTTASIHTNVLGITASIPLTSVFMSYGGDPAGPLSVEADTQHKIRVAGTVTNGQVFISTAPTQNITFFSRKNGADGAITIAVASGTSGLFEDTTHTDNIVSGDLVCWRIIASGSSTSTIIEFLGCAIDHGSGSTQTEVFGFTSTGALINQDNFFSAFGNIVESSTEAATEFWPPFQAIWSNMRIYLNSNSTVVPTTFNFRVNGASATQTVVVAPGTTGLFEDQTSKDVVGVGSRCTIKATVGANSFNLTTTAFTINDVVTPQDMVSIACMVGP